MYEPEKTKQELYELISSLRKDKVGVIGHSLGGQMAVMLVSEHPELFCFAVFLSAWVNPRAETIKCIAAYPEYLQNFFIGDGWFIFRGNIGISQRNRQ